MRFVFQPTEGWKKKKKTRKAVVYAFKIIQYRIGRFVHGVFSFKKKAAIVLF